MGITIERGDWQDLPRQGQGLRAFAMGDVHGLSEALRAAFDLVGERAAAGGPDHLVMLGDYIDRGPDSLGVLDLIDHGIAGVRLTALAGNHEGALVTAVDRDSDDTLEIWERNGGDSVMRELGIGLYTSPGRVWAAFSDAQRNLLDRLQPYYHEGDFVFVHAGLHPGFASIDAALNYSWRTMPGTWHEELRSPFWVREAFLNAPANPEGAFVIHGHTPSATPELRPHRLGLDVGSFRTGRLAVAELDGDRVRIAIVSDDSQSRRWRKYR